MAEMDRHQLALAYVHCKLWQCSRTHDRRLETLAGWTRVRRSVAKKLLAGFSLTAGKTVVN